MRKKHRQVETKKTRGSGDYEKLISTGFFAG
jgi:hypothetical protein